MPLPGQRRTQNGGLGPQLRSASALTDVSGEQRARVADLRRR
ncbi:DeoR family transcriptional regulator [Streptomyces sp. HCCB10043]|nr:DeoR family transcriptional regulator [Streptomyces sp. HCCB10043]